MKVKYAGRRFWHALALLPLMAIAVLLAGRDVVPVHAANPQPIHVNTTADLLTSSNGSCSLREAIHAANENVADDGCTAGTPDNIAVDTIDLPAGHYALTIAGPGEDFNTSGDLDVTQSGLLAPSSINIIGNGPANTFIEAGTGFDDRLLDVELGDTANVSGVMFQGGVGASGGGILNHGTLSLTDSVLYKNSGIDFGGGIWNDGTLTLTDTTVTSNRTTGSNLTGGGGGIFSQGPNLTLIRSTVDTNNTNGRGGGIYNLDLAANLTESTVSGNHALNGGGIFNRAGTVSAQFSTIAFNVATSAAGGVWNFSGTLALKDSIDGKNTLSDCMGSITDQGFNLAGDGTCSLSPSGSNNNNAVLNLLPLAVNSPGSTATHELGAGSVAIDGADPNVCPPTPATDQRGVVRPQGFACDVGAYEALAGSIKICKNTNPPAGTGFTFVLAYPGNPPPHPAPFPLDDTQCNTAAGLTGGPYTFSELTSSAGWTITDIVCTGGTNVSIGSNVGFDLGDAGGTINLGAGENVICTFTNTNSTTSTPCLAAGGLDISTGSNIVFLNGTNKDLTWNLTSAPAGVPLSARRVSGDYVLSPPWVQPTAPANWDGPITPGGDVSDPPGTYVYETSFSVPAGAPIVLNFHYAADNSVVFTLGGPGAVTPALPSSFTSPLTNAYSSPAPYLAGYISDPVSTGGTYTLSATVTNAAGSYPGNGNPSGLLVEGTVKCTTQQRQVIWADNNCDGLVTPFDALLVALTAASLTTVAPAGCPSMTQAVNIATFSQDDWGDIDCIPSGFAPDIIKILQFVASITVTPTAGCPTVGQSVSITF
jgi:CSLREA domain-containing protein